MTTGMMINTTLSTKNYHLSLSPLQMYCAFYCDDIFIA